MSKFTNRKTAHGFFALVICCIAATAHAQSAGEEMSFFITSVGKGDGANLGGLEGADAHCNALASATGSTKTFAAYLSTSMSIDRSTDPMTITNGVSARDRIGSGPWYNANGELIANNVEDLHTNSVNINLQSALDENGNPVNGRGSQPNKHDILTGSDSAGYFSTAGGDTTCSNWTSNSEDGSAIVGHHDRVGLNDARNMISWNSSHGSRGCGEEHLPRSGGAGLFYCFATD
ncbi:MULTISPECIES: hypothetical protein [unclassified Ruegeria]|uniref:hypothetical protein n=1 Tax=unclassified Ruegeria TaxID=2625375 RepID=UPI00147A34D9|nr:MULTISPECIES: hypothetical protein [unclassified Ruegeria]